MKGSRFHHPEAEVDGFGFGYGWLHSQEQFAIVPGTQIRKAGFVYQTRLQIIIGWNPTKFRFGSDDFPKFHEVNF